MAIVNGCIIHKDYYKNKISKPFSYVKYLKRLHLQLLQLQEVDMYEGSLFGAQSEIRNEIAPLMSNTNRSPLTAQLVNEWRDEGTQNKRRQRTCKVCSALRTKPSRATTASFCGECRQDSPIFLCVRPRRQIRGVALTSWDIWHHEWECGALILAESTQPIRMRKTPMLAPTSTPRIKRRTTPVSKPNSQVLCGIRC